MAPSHIESHASSKTPSAFIPRQERLDLTMSKHVLHKSPTFSCAHLNYLECRGQSVFADERCANLFMNALRLHWKVSGRTLRNASDQGKDLYELFMLEVGDKRIISDLFTDDAIYHLLERDSQDGMMIMTAIVHDIYASQWQVWADEQNSKHKHQGRHALIISHAQATSNQLSNNVLAFKEKAAPELKRWAEETVSRHLIAIVTPGHLPSRPPARDLFGTNNITDFALRPTNHDSNRYTPDQGSYDRNYQVPSGSASSIKRKAPTSSFNNRTSPTSKRVRVKTEGTDDRPYETYRPSSTKRPTLSNGHGRLNYRDSHVSPHTPAKHVDRREQAYDTPTHEELHRAKLHEVNEKISQQQSTSTSSIDFAEFDLNGSQEHDAPVVNGPSYMNYLRSQERDAEAPMTVSNARTAIHARIKSLVGSEDGEVFE